MLRAEWVRSVRRQRVSRSSRRNHLCDQNVLHFIHFETVSMVSQRVEAYTLDRTLHGICIDHHTQQNARPRYFGCFHRNLHMLRHVHAACLILAVLKRHVHIFHVDFEDHP